MSSKTRTLDFEIKARLSTTWIFVLLNILFRDIHELFRPGFLQEVMTGSVNGNQMTEGFLLAAGILLEIPVAMVVLSRLLPYRINRWSNIIAAGLTILSILAVGPNDLDEVFFAAVELLALSLLIWYAWKWTRPAPETKSAISNTG